MTGTKICEFYMSMEKTWFIMGEKEMNMLLLFRNKKDIVETNNDNNLTH